MSDTLSATLLKKNTLLAIGKEYMLCVGQRHQRYSIMVQVLN